MVSILANWKTTSLGVAAILAALGDVATAIGHGTSPNIDADVTGLITGFGLIFAGDASASKQKGS